VLLLLLLRQLQIFAAAAVRPHRFHYHYFTIFYAFVEIRFWPINFQPNQNTDSAAGASVVSGFGPLFADPLVRVAQCSQLWCQKYQLHVIHQLTQ
jgi:hypothetical protein